MKSWKSLAIASLLYLCTGLAQAFMPQAGSWVISSELDGKPGRGMAIDVQNNLLVMTVYAYEANGNPTFYLTSGVISNNQFSGNLASYRGGRYLGSGARSGSEAGIAGTVRLRFTSGVSGFITFPGEPEVAMERFNFAYPAVPSSLAGIWTFVSNGSEGLMADSVELIKTIGGTTNGNGLITTNDGLFGCEHQIRGNAAGLVMCVKTTAQGVVSRSYIFGYSVNEGEGYSLRGSTGTQQLMVAKRITNMAGVATGIVHKHEGAEPDGSALSAYISEMAANYVPH